jgi:hypothetical protein
MGELAEEPEDYFTLEYASIPLYNVSESLCTSNLKLLESENGVNTAYFRVSSVWFRDYRIVS